MATKILCDHLAFPFFEFVCGRVVFPIRSWVQPLDAQLACAVSRPEHQHGQDTACFHMLFQLLPGLIIEAVDLKRFDSSSTDTNLHYRLTVLVKHPPKEKELDIAAL